MLRMNVPKFLWGEAMKSATYLINRMSLRVLDNKSPIELLLNSKDFVVPSKVFGCVCYVHNYRNNVGKLNPHFVKYVFVGYSPTQNGYRCWYPSERRFFVSMDVTFREYESYYEPSNDTGITLCLHLKYNKRGRVTVEAFKWAPFLFLLRCFLWG